MIGPFGMDKVLITGGLGYLGQRLAASLKSSGNWEVVLLTRRSHIIIDSVLGCEILRFSNSWGREGQHLLKGVRKIVHLACPDDKTCREEPVKAAQEAFEFTHGLLQQAGHYGVESVVLASSIHVYGAALHHSVTEQTVPRPRRMYGIIKRFMEDLVQVAELDTGINATILRLSNGFGAPVSPNISQWGLLINDLCRKSIECRRIELRSNPHLLCNFITLTDICGAIGHFLSFSKATKEYGVIQVGSSHARSLGEMAKLVRDRCHVCLGFTPELVLPPDDLGDPVPLKYDISRLLATQFTPQEDFAAEIDATLVMCSKWFTPQRHKMATDIL